MTGRYLALAVGLLLALGLAAGCEDSTDVVGPFTGDVHRFVVDDIRLATSNTESAAMGGDLDGDHKPDNLVGQALAALRNLSDNLSPHGAEMIRSGVIASTVELQADDLADDDTVAVRYLGADDAPAVLVGGRLIGGAFVPNRSATTHVPGEATVRLPIFRDADPVEVRLHGLEIELTPDATGGGYTAELHGAIDARDIFVAVHGGLVQMVAANPGSHLVFERSLDRDRDGAISVAEVETESLLKSLLTPDLDGLRTQPGRFLSFGFQVHLAPCAAGRCIAGPPADPCHDRVRDGNETDVDCGGSCALACAASLACATPTDCQSRSCTGGTCAAPTCADGLRDGFESDVDCGGSCLACTLGKRCAADADCSSFNCTGSFEIGTCQPPGP